MLKLGLAYARSGDARNAERLAGQLARLYPTDTLLKNRDLPLIRAAIAVQQNHPLAAIALLESAIPTELGNLDVAYTRGQAYLLLRRGAGAATEFQKIVRYRGFLLSTPRERWRISVLPARTRPLAAPSKPAPPTRTS